MTWVWNRAIRVASMHCYSTTEPGLPFPRFAEVAGRTPTPPTARPLLFLLCSVSTPLQVCTSLQTLRTDLEALLTAAPSTTTSSFQKPECTTDLSQGCRKCKNQIKARLNRMAAQPAWSSYRAWHRVLASGGAGPDGPVPHPAAAGSTEQGEGDSHSDFSGRAFA